MVRASFPGVTSMHKPIAVLALLGFVMPAAAQAPANSAPTAAQDHQQMMAQLGIKRLRPDTSAGPNWSRFSSARSMGAFRPPHRSWPARYRASTMRPWGSSQKLLMPVLVIFQYG